jgi:hypothetical protein
MMELIKKLNRAIEPYYLLITMLIFFIAGFFSLAKFILSPPDVLVTVKKENIHYPSSINQDYAKLYQYIQDSTKSSQVQNLSYEVYKYLNNTKTQWILDIQNNTDHKIKSINIRMSDVSDLTSKGVSSEFLLDEETEKLLQNLIFQKNTGILYLKDGVDLPPNGTLKISLWGEFNNYDWIESLSIDYENGTAKIEYPKLFVGWKALVANYFLEIFIFIIATFVLIYYLLVKKYVVS